MRKVTLSRVPSVTDCLYHLTQYRLNGEWRYLVRWIRLDVAPNL